MNKKQKEIIQKFYYYVFEILKDERYPFDMRVTVLLMLKCIFDFKESDKDV